jgi:hypothetical protein
MNGAQILRISELASARRLYPCAARMSEYDEENETAGDGLGKAETDNVARFGVGMGEKKGGEDSI